MHTQLQSCFSLTHSSKIFIHTWYHLLSSVFTHIFYSRCLPLPMVHWSCSPTLQSTRISKLNCILIAERIFSLLTPADLCNSLQVCTTWNYQICSVPKFMDKVSAHRRKCKENAENHHASKKQMEVIVFPTRRQPLATFTPNTLTQIQTKETCSTTVSFKCIKPVWHKSGCSGRVSPSKRPRQSEDICGTKKSKKRLRRL